MNFLVLITDAFGGRGGIAKFNRDLLRALCLHPDVGCVTALPRVILESVGDLPAGLRYEQRAARGKPAFAYRLGEVLIQPDPFAAVVCGHLHLLGPAALAARRYRVPLVLITHGIEAWQPPRRRGLGCWLRSVDVVVSVSHLTQRRLFEWAPFRERQRHVIPNCVELSNFGLGPKPAYVLERHGLEGRRVIMTLARLSGPERHKGIDEVLEALPLLVRQVPDLAYLIVGDGVDRPRLQAKVAALGLDRHVVFAGYIRDGEKADYYRAADAFVMPGRGEGFGIVFLEAMACGIPVVASKADASREAVLDGRLGQIVDPGSPSEIRAAINTALASPRSIPAGLAYFSFDRFVERWHAVLRPLFGRSIAA